MCCYLAADNYALRFQQRGTSDYVVKRCMPSLNATTVCLWMKSTDTSSEGTPLSYNVHGSDNELLLYNYKKFKFHIASEHRYTRS